MKHQGAFLGVGHASVATKAASAAYRALTPEQRHNFAVQSRQANVQQDPGSHDRQTVGDMLRSAHQIAMESCHQVVAAEQRNDGDIRARTSSCDLAKGKVHLNIASQHAAADRLSKQQADARRLVIHANSATSISTLHPQEQAMASFCAHSVPNKSFPNTTVFEMIPPVAKLVDSIMANTGPPVYNKEHKERFGTGSFHKTFREVWATRHASWQHAQQAKFPKSVPISQGNKSLCRQCGVCVCGNNSLDAFLKTIVALIKMFYSPSSKWLDCCEVGACVLEFR